MIQIMKNKTFILIIFLCFLPLFCKGQFCKLYSTHGDISSSMISHIYQDAKGYIWVATENGLNKYDGAKFTNYKNQFNDSTSLLGNHVYRTFQDAKGHLYILSTKGLQMYEYKSDSFKTIKKSNSSYNNKSIAQLSDGSILIGTSGYGIKKLTFDHKGNIQIENWNPSLIGHTINDIMEDRKGNIWICTEYHGMIRIDKNKKIHHYTLGKLYGNQFINCCTEDSNGNIYAGTSGRGVFIYNQADNTFHQIFHSNFPIKVLTQEINLSHYDNSFYIEFATDNFISPQNYLYSMNNGTWNSLPKGSSRVSFSNLPVGKYEFKVKAINGTSESKIKTIVINIHPAWYNSGLAWVIYILIIISIIAIFIHQAKEKYRVRQEMLKHKHLEEINERKLQFFINISHEIRTPMSLIISPLQKLISTDNDSERQKSYSLIERNAQRILNLINQLMDIRKIDKNQMKLSFTEVDLISFINDIKNTFAYQAAAKGAKLNIITQMESLKVWLDPNNFDKVIFNLLSNSFKHIQNEGEINIYINSVNNSSNVYPLNNYAEIIIEDNGTGIKESEMERIFERFYQISDDRSRSKGTGIGLHLSMSLIKMHHGTITVKNNENKSGCSFTIHIPLGCSHLSTEELYQNSNKNISEQPSIEDQPLQHIPASIEENENSEDGTKKVIRKKHSILIVEDEDEIRNYLLTELGSHFRVLSCSNGKEALDLIMHHMPDLVLSDIMMPEVNGITLLRKLKQNIKTNHIPVILLTAKNSEKDYIEGLSLGADAYIAKPFNLDILITTIENLIKNREILRNNFSGKQEQNDNIEVAQPQSADEKLMQKVLKVINKNLNNPDLNAEMIAAEVGISRVHLYRKLKELTNQSTRDFIRNIRLKQAEILLKSEKNYSMSEIAQLVGFNNTTYFSNAFKELYGVSPSKYTERCKEKEEEKKDDLNSATLL